MVEVRDLGLPSCSGDHMPQIESNRSNRSNRSAGSNGLCSGLLRTGRLAAFLLVAPVALALPAGTARAGDVKGEVQFEPRQLGSPPVRNQGFIERIENPLRPIQAFDPRPHLVVVLDEGPVDEAATQAPAAPVAYTLVGESFDAPLMPVVAKTRVELRNGSPRQVVLFTPDDPDLVDSVALKPKGFHEFQIARPGQVVLIRSQDSVHLSGRVVAFPHRYFAAVDARGRFEIKGVPEGTWKARLWYRDGWVEGVEAKVEVGPKSTDLTLKVSPTKIRQTLAK
jgi:hypothetical protein